MKKNKKGLALSLTAITSLAIFIIMLISIIMYFRGCDTGRHHSEGSLKDVKEAIERVQRVPGAVESTQVLLGKESMIIGYAPGHQNIYTRFTDRIFVDGKFPSYTEALILGSDSWTRGKNYTFPKDDGSLEGTLQDIGTPNFVGYVKRRAPSCPTNDFCICDCINFILTTNEGSKFGSENAFIECTKENCVSVKDVNMGDVIYVKDFLSYSSDHMEKDDEDYKLSYPKPHTLHWEGGFIMVRTEEENYPLGKTIQSICSEASTGTYYVSGGDCPGVVIKSSSKIFNQIIILAGHVNNYASDFFDLRIENIEPGKLVFTII